MSKWSGSAKRPSCRLAAPSTGMTEQPAGIWTPPSSVSRLATRGIMINGGDPPNGLPGPRDRLRHKRAVGTYGVQLVRVRQQREQQVAERAVGGLDARGKQ